MIVLLVAVGGMISIISGYLWRKYKSFHLLPWFYAFAICLLPTVNQGRTIFHTIEPWVIGLIFYSLAWLVTIRQK
jgi:hypothetical protein